MDTLFEELKTVLSDELNIHTNCVNIAADMNTAIKQKEVDKVQRLTGQFDVLIGQIEMLEVRRLELCDDITRAFKPQNRHMNLQGIIALIPEKDKKPFSEIRTSLKEKINELSKVNTSNRLLLHESISVIGKNFEMITESQNRLAGYKQTGTMEKKLVRKNIVNHIA